MMIKALHLSCFILTLYVLTFAVAQSEMSEGLSELKTQTSYEFTRLLKFRLGLDSINESIETGIEGAYQNRFGDEFAYLMDNGRFVLIDDSINLESTKNLTEVSLRGLIINKINDIASEDMVIFPAVFNEKSVLNIFTDVSCSYCAKLHAEVHFLQKAGITVRYFPFPRGGSKGPGYIALKKVWCSEDRQIAMGVAKGTETGELGSADCAKGNMVDRGFELGQNLGVTGTPTLFLKDGEKINGYIPYQRLIPKILGEI